MESLGTRLEKKKDEIIKAEDKDPIWKKKEVKKRTIWRRSQALAMKTRHALQAMNKRHRMNMSMVARKKVGTLQPNQKKDGAS